MKDHERPAQINKQMEDPGHGPAWGGIQREIALAYTPFLWAKKLKRLDEMGKLHCVPESGTKH